MSYWDSEDVDDDPRTEKCQSCGEWFEPGDLYEDGVCSVRCRESLRRHVAAAASVALRLIGVKP